MVLNIAEGSAGQTIPEFKWFLHIGLRSAVEVVAFLYLAGKRKDISEETYQKHFNE